MPIDDLMVITGKGPGPYRATNSLFIKNYFADPSVIAARQNVGLDRRPTDVEIEALAQTWSEHCKHKIFNALIDYEEDGKVAVIDSLFKTYCRFNECYPQEGEEGFLPFCLQG